MKKHRSPVSDTGSFRSSNVRQLAVDADGQDFQPTLSIAANDRGTRKRDRNNAGFPYAVVSHIVMGVPDGDSGKIETLSHSPGGGENNDLMYRKLDAISCDVGNSIGETRGLPARVGGAKKLRVAKRDPYIAEAYNLQWSAGYNPAQSRKRKRQELQRSLQCLECDQVFATAAFGDYLQPCSNCNSIKIRILREL